MPGAVSRVLNGNFSVEEPRPYRHLPEWQLKIRARRLGRKIDSYVRGGYESLAIPFRHELEELSRELDWREQ